MSVDIQNKDAENRSLQNNIYWLVREHKECCLRDVLEYKNECNVHVFGPNFIQYSFFVCFFCQGFCSFFAAPKC